MNIDGILNNTPNIYDAVNLKTDNALTIDSEEYQNGQAITCSMPGVTIFDTGLIPEGTFSGTYSIGFFYDSSSATVQGTELMRFEIYEDGELLEEDTTYYASDDLTLYQFDLNYIEDVITYGLFQNFTLKANSTYQIVIKTSHNLEDDAILDYVIFEKVPNNIAIDTKPFVATVGIRNSGDNRNIGAHGVQLGKEIVIGEITGTWASMENYVMGFTYNENFKTIAMVIPTLMDGDGRMHLDLYSIDYANSQVRINIRNISDASWTATQPTNVRISIEGYI